MLALNVYLALALLSALARPSTLALACNVPVRLMVLGLVLVACMALVLFLALAQFLALTLACQAFALVLAYWVPVRLVVSDGLIAFLAPVLVQDVDLVLVLLPALEVFVGSALV